MSFVISVPTIACVVFDHKIGDRWYFVVKCIDGKLHVTFWD